MSEWIVPLITLSALEIVLGIDNIIFITILAGKLPPDKQPKARRWGLILALLSRLALLAFVDTLRRATDPLFTLPDFGVIDSEAAAISTKDLVLLIGGTFLIGKATWEIHDKLEGESEAETHGENAGKVGSLSAVLIQIMLIDLVFSLDSVITAVGMVDNLWVIVVAMVLTVAVMMFAAGPIGNFVSKHPTLKILALSFLILIGVILVAEGMAQHINKGYIYFAMGFSFTVEMINLQMRKERRPVKLREPQMPVEQPDPSL